MFVCNLDMLLNLNARQLNLMSFKSYIKTDTYTNCTLKIVTIHVFLKMHLNREFYVGVALISYTKFTI